MSRRREAAELARALALSTQEAAVITSLSTASDSPAIHTSATSAHDFREMELRPVYEMATVDPAAIMRPPTSSIADPSSSRGSGSSAINGLMSVIQSFTPSHLLHQSEHIPGPTASRISVQSLTGRSSPVSGGAIPSSRLGSSSKTSNPTASGSSDSSRRPLFSPTQVSAPAGQIPTPAIPVEPVPRTPLPRTATPPQIRTVTSAYALSSSPEEETRPPKLAEGRVPLSDSAEPEEPVEAPRQPSPRTKNVVQVVLSSRHRSPSKRVRQSSPSSPDPLNLGPRSSAGSTESRTPLISTKRGEVLPPASKRLTPQDSFAESIPVVRISARQQQAKAKEEAAKAERRRLRAERKAREAEEKRRAEEAGGEVEESIEYMGQSSAASSRKASQKESKRDRVRHVEDEVLEQEKKRAKPGVSPKADPAPAPARSSTRKDRRSSRQSPERVAAVDLEAKESRMTAPSPDPKDSKSPARAPVVTAAARSPMKPARRSRVVESPVEADENESAPTESGKAAEAADAEPVKPASEPSKSVSPAKRSPLGPVPARLNSPALSVSSPINRYSPGPSKDGIKWKTNRSDLSSVLSKFQGSKLTGMSRKLKIVPLHSKIGPPAKAPPPLPKKPEKRKKGESDDDTEEEEGDGEERRAKRDKEWLMQDDQGF